MSTMTDAQILAALLRARHASRIREEAERIREFAGYVIARVEAGRPETTDLYAADITASAQRMMLAQATIAGLDVLAADSETPEGDRDR